MKINDSLKNEIRERKHPTDPFHPVQRLFPFNGGSPLPLCQPHLSCLVKSYISQSADPEKWCEVVAVSCRFLHSRRRRKTVMARDFPNGSASKPNLSCCCVARRSFFFLCGCVNWPLWLSHDGFLPTWVWNVCSKWLCGWRKDAFGCLQFTLQIAETSFFAAAPLAVADPSGLSRCHRCQHGRLRGTRPCSCWQRWESWWGITLGEDRTLSWCLSLKRLGQLGAMSQI